jgi:DNA-binding IclR family transcriptional regulator/quercetin dioxygenase-like cupin family protein
VTEAPINQSVERAVRLLGFFSADEPELTLPQLTERLGTARATTHRYAMALRRVGLLRYDAAGGIYSLGPRIVELAATALSGLRIIRIAGPHMERLAAELNETVVLSIWDGESPIVVRVADNTDRVVHLVVRTGSRLARSDSAQGKIFLAFGGDGSELNPRELQRILESAIAVNTQTRDGIRAVATPVFQDREAIAAMAVVGTIPNLPESETSKLAVRLRRKEHRLMPAYTWEEIPDEPVREGVRRRAFGTEDAMLVLNYCEPGMAVNPHTHDFDQIAMITKGTAVYHIGDEPCEVGPGSIMLIPAGVEHYIEPTGSETVENIDVFAPARSDYMHLLEWLRPT